MNIQGRLFSRFLSIVLTFLMSAVSTFLIADDTEIYFSGSGGLIKPNVLFVFDTSVSMAQDVITGDLNNDGDLNDPGENENLGSRIDVLSNVMQDLLSRLDNVRVGMMRMNGAKPPGSNGTSLACKHPDQVANGGETYIGGVLDPTHTGSTTRTSANANNACYLSTGGTVLFPVTDIDAAASTVTGEAAQNLATILVPISQSEDDAEQVDGSTVAETDNRLLQMSGQICGVAAGTLPYIDREYRITGGGPNEAAQEMPGSVLKASIDIGEDYTGFRFTSVDIPRNAFIENAYLEFVARSNGVNDVNVAIYGDADGYIFDPDRFLIGDGPADRLAGTALTDAVVDWAGIASTSPDAPFRSPDISPIVQEIVNASGWNPGQSMAFLMDNDSSVIGSGREIYRRSQDSSKRARLVVRYCDYEPVRNDRFAGEITELGLRFQDVPIPQGADIQSAEIIFTAANPNVNVNNRPALSISVEEADDTVAFDTTAPNRPSDRTWSTTNLSWGVGHLVAQGGPLNQGGDWVVGNTYTTVDMSSLVQRVVDRSGWCGGNSMAFRIEQEAFLFGPAGSVRRTVSSYDDDPARAPVLRVTYDTGGITGNPGDTGCNKVDYNIPVARGLHDSKQFPDNRNRTAPASLELGLPEGGDTSEYGVIFSLPVERDIQVDEALLQFTMSQNSQIQPASFFVNAEDVGNAQDFISTANDIGNRPRVEPGNGNIVQADPPGMVPVDQTITLDVTSLVQSVVQRTDWAMDNQIALFVKGQNGQERRAYSYNGDVIKAPRLLLKVEESVTGVGSTVSATTVRRRLLEIADALNIPSLLAWTPSVETLYEAALYWRGKAVDFGRQRGSAPLGPLTVDGETIDYREQMRNTLTSHPGSWTGGTYNDGPGGGTDCQFSNTADCAQDYIDGNPVYNSPLNIDQCAANYMIFLTDGAPTLTSQGTETKILSEFSEISACVDSDRNVNAQDSRGRCAVEMVEAMANNDQDGDPNNGEQVVKTYTIAFNLSGGNAGRWLEQIARAGDGRSYSASSTDELLDVFDNIFGEVLSTSSAFASPAITTNFFNRTRSRDEIYFGLFTPELESKWDGNVKRFRVCVDDDTVDPVSNMACTAAQVRDTEILDQNGNDAVDDMTLLFNRNSQSYWSASADGSSTITGGAGAQVTDYRDRLIYTDEVDIYGYPPPHSSGISLPYSLGIPGFNFNHTNWDNNNAFFSFPYISATNFVCNNPNDVSAGSECSNKMLWLLGRDILDEDGDGDTTDTRWGMGDIIHASPVILTYGFSDTLINADTDGDGTADSTNGQLDPGETLIDKLLVNTNAGGMRMINPNNGTEDWIFMPVSTLENVGALFENQQQQHLYGLDATPVLHQVDVNNDGTITPSDGDFVRVYQVMRRGGQFVYALDLSPSYGTTLTSSADTVVPTLLWRLQGGTGDYTRMGDTWSRPVVATINVRDSGDNLVEKDVLIMGGGYDNDLDENFGTANANPNRGNAIYIIDPDDGSLLLSISHAADAGNSIAASGADLEIPGFHHSITASVSVLDSNSDGVTDRVYFPDTGGNVWRIDLGHDIKDDGSGFDNSASITTRTIVGHVADLSSDSTLSEQRRFYQDLTAVQVVDTVYTDTVTATDNSDGRLTYLLLTSGYRAHPLDVDVEDRFYALRDKAVNHLVDVDSDRVADGTGFTSPITESDLTSVTSSALSDTSRNSTAVKSSRGYYLDFPGNGEKGLSTITVLFGQVFFTSYVPSTGASVSNTCSADIGESFGYALDLATGDGIIDWDLDGDVNVSDRRHLLGSGLTSDPLPIFTDAGVKIITGLQQSVQSLSGLNANSIQRTYWYQDD